jgi:hypothetical protein
MQVNPITLSPPPALELPAGKGVKGLVCARQSLGEEEAM